MKKLFRSKSDRKIAGICGGLGQLLEIDPTIIRLIVVFVFFATGLFPTFIAYVVGWIIIPEEAAG